ncbi:MAG: hypothetical protein ACJ72D_16725 [Marmoricola sp.]
MTESDENTTADDARTEAVQAVVDRVVAWQHGATDGVVHDELRSGLDEAGVSLDDSEFEQLASAIESADGPVDASSYVH